MFFCTGSPIFLYVLFKAVHFHVLFICTRHFCTNQKNDNTVSLTLPMPVRIVKCDDHVTADKGLAALQRGPIVYCIEEQDCSVPIEQLTAGQFAAAAVSFRENILGGVTVLTGEGVTDVPYFAWSNRGAGKMKVWIPE